MSRRQKGKNHKRRKSWHRGRTEAHRALHILDQLPTTMQTAPTGAPQPLRRTGGQNRGDTA